MELTNKQIVAAQEALGKMLNTNLPAKQAYHINKTLASIKDQIRFVDGQRMELIKKYGVETEDGNYEIPADAKENREKFFAEWKDLLELKENIDVRQLDLNDLDRVELTANEMETVEFIIKTEE